MVRVLFILGIVVLTNSVASGGECVKLWFEAEDYVAQHGSTAPKYNMPNASAGFIVDNNWGGEPGAFLRFDVDLPRDMAKVYVALRYARAMPGDAVVLLQIDGRPEKPVSIRLPSTGGWGFRDEEWSFAQAELPGASKGKHTLVIRSELRRNNVNTDGFFLSDRPVDIDAALPQLYGEKDSEALDAAIRHLADRYGDRYPQAVQFLARLDKLRAMPADEVSDDFAALQHEALVEANPLLDFPGLLFTRRHPLGGQHYAYTEAISWTRDRPRTWRPGSSLCTLSPVRRDGEVTVLVDSPQGVIRDPDVHWDGSRILFAHKKSLDDDDYHLYELDTKTGRVRQLTRDAGFADYEGCYLPCGDIAFNSSRCVQSVDCFPVPASNLYRMEPDGSHIRRLTVNPVHDNFPTVLNDGRVVFTRWEYNDRWVLHVQGLAVMNPDGTGVTAMYGNNSFWPISMLHARAVPSSTLVVATLSGHHDVDQCGEIGLFEMGLGQEEAGGCVQLWPPREIQPTKDEFYWRRLSAQYQYPYPLSGNFFLASCRPRGKKHFGIYLIDTFGNRVLLHAAPNISCNSPMPLAPRERPPVVPCRVDYSQTEATVHLVDVYRGPGLKGVKRGEVKALRIVEIINRPTGSRHWAGMDGTPPMGLCSSWDAKRVVGTVPVAEDGSARFTVPAGTAIYFQPLDAKNRALQWMRSWATPQPGEVLTCVGCHESRVQTPPVDQTAGRAREPVRLPSWHSSDRPFSFHEDVQPVLDRHCIRCHDHNHPKGIDLRGDKTDGFSLAYEHLRLHLKIPGTRQDPPMIPPKSHGAIASSLIRMLEDGHNDVELSVDDWDRLVTWIDLNAPYYGTYAITRYDANFGRCAIKDPAPLWKALGDRCFECHKQASQPPHVPEGGFARFGKHKGRNFVWSTKDRYDTSNAVLINLTHPEQSRLLRAPLAKAAGGLGLHDPSPLSSTDDQVYRAALDVIRRWADELRRRPREDMPNAQACGEYLVWMRKRQEADAIEKRSRRKLAERP